jgi:hypothetical protein
MDDDADDEPAGSKCDTCPKGRRMGGVGVVVQAQHTRKDMWVQAVRVQGV